MEPATSTPSAEPDEGLRRRVVYLILFRLVLISLVLGSTLLLWWISDVDLTTPSSAVLYTIIGATYVLTIAYALAVSRVSDLGKLASVQLAIDLVLSALLVHVTGGAQSGYTFFFPLSIIAAAIIHLRRGAVVMAVAASLLFAAVALLGWLDVLPVPPGQRVLPSDLSPLALGRAVALNLAACAGVAVLASNLGSQIQQTSASLATQQSAVADLRALHEDIVRCLSSGLITVDDDGLVLTMNQAAAHILGGNGDEAGGRPLAELMPGIERYLAEVPQQATAQRLELSLPDTGEGERHLGLSVSPLRDNAERVIGRVVHFQDLTELRELERQMRRAERLALVGTLAAGIAHEIRNPLAAISGSIELLRAAPQGDEDGRALMEIVTREVDRLDTLITDLLDYTNPQPRELVDFDLVTLTRETVQVFEHDKSHEGVALEMESNGTAEIQADPNRIRQVLWNLLRNAADVATESVRVGVRRGEGRMVVLEVVDDGPGIAAEHVERVFDPFFTTKSKGSGLGLATCHSIVVEHGGTIRAENVAAGGCRFVVELPQAGTRGRARTAS
ncbi:sensor histidine kinase [Haliangium sp.]|uniref:sensor histidine kinase n=1 Tax=Haliangium sp. TaxID=2663208 RepID=UPI003D0DE312